ncbi:PTS sugar transporter subunit IIA [Alkaliphilus peptidifermentans]|uniref:PTS system IIA component, Glc family n=1 Tax=Alkaliphilus peptidifermentans DSM 18978 TaxID=1120976 RepID=A0A1G5IM45_9FIRM|nr:PTS glucose transporter subunit IIA [Alkaliphilus peptidifermentans]SCY77142.1 PTS system IIA component, Glc family [Alkaliphilus peptidifermentans DSM 18978]
MLSIFKKKTDEKPVKIFAPLRGEVIPIEQVPDPVFSQKLLGDGVAIEPTEGVIYSPVNGEIICFFETKHAIGIKSDNGVEILIHVGLDTVELKGNGFTGHIKNGDLVKMGQKLLEFDMELIGSRVKSLISPVVITNSEEKQYNIKKNLGTVESLDSVIMEVE